MSTQVQLNRVIIVALFVIVFIAVGWAAPVMYATYAPQEQFVQVTQFSPQNTTVGSEYHTVCWQTKVNQPAPADVDIKMILVDDGSHYEVYQTTFYEYFGNDQNVTPFKQRLPPNLKPGKYRYKAVAELHLANGRVKRTMTWTSDPFYIKNESTSSTHNTSC